MRRLLLILGLALAAPAMTGTAAPAAAQTLADYDYENLAFRGVGVDFGHIWADKVQNTAMYSVRIDLGYLGPGVRIIPSISYWSSEFTLEHLDRLAERISEAAGVQFSGEDLGRIRWSDISLSIDGHFVWNTPARVLTWVGAGFGLHALNGQGEAIRATFVEDLLDAISASLAPLAGLEFEPFDRLRVYGEGRYTIMNSIQYLSVRGGLQFMLTQGTGIPVGMAVPAPPILADADPPHTRETP
jgi:opacity protein-like surface antigen